MAHHVYRTETRESSLRGSAQIAQSWMVNYRTAWQTLDPYLATKLYAPSGINRPNPFSSAITPEQIPLYWTSLAQTQCDNFLEYELLDIAQDQAVVLYRCLTTQPSSRIRQSICGVLVLRFSGVACAEKMEWSSWSNFRDVTPAMPTGKIRTAISYLEQSLERKVDIHDLAQRSNLSPRHASRVLGLFTGMSPHQYLIRRRLLRAGELLAWTDEPIVEIALALGFASQSHFTSVFRQATTYTPAEFRARFLSTHKDGASEWVQGFRRYLEKTDAEEVARHIGVPARHLNLCVSAGRRLPHLISTEILVNTPSTAIVHWQLSDEVKSNSLVGDGIFLLNFAPEGICRSTRQLDHWR